MTLGPSQVGAMVDVSAFDLRPEQENGAAALCLHGLTGTPYEVRPIAETLVARGVRAHGIWMAGHNGTVDDLAATTQQEWMGLAEEALEALRAEHDRIYLVGVSMGGLVSLRLAETSRVDGVVTVGTPLELPPPIPQVLPLIRLFRKSRPKRASGVEDPEAMERHPTFPAMPFDAVRELIRLQKLVRRDLGKIKCPILVAHGEQDETARPRDAALLHATVGTAESHKRLLMLARSGHVATVDYDGPELARVAAEFLTQDWSAAGGSNKGRGAESSA